ncbi:hypothetical protein CONPUDRAFT_156284 [Coniophora puteana RWD-64-598 SS2]|uniref:Uncharacterized protein n=1 Tax=Coniophora puteana (strain RWD-64-598) TaxID=741705 RepID=A0A5M3MGC0_CONPW|nr:uncharacterized protein CONPUDRAFT_156284 [Coniophora puteana RWD-64-598 SS2]EIW78288.1 hypothetical protein CONPUDRAFT_156284 [Coniophora puteana RWD-64-598 SS2]
MTGLTYIGRYVAPWSGSQTAFRNLSVARYILDTLGLLYHGSAAGVLSSGRNVSPEIPVNHEFRYTLLPPDYTPDCAGTAGSALPLSASAVSTIPPTWLGRCARFVPRKVSSVLGRKGTD